MMACVEEVAIGSIEGHELRLRLPIAPTAAGEPWSFVAELSNPYGHASARVWDIGDGVAVFFADLAASWQGWDGERTWSSLEGQLGLACRHDRLGVVTCVVRLGSVMPPEWSFETLLSLGAGAHLEGIADDVKAFLPAHHPSW